MQVLRVRGPVVIAVVVVVVVRRAKHDRALVHLHVSLDVAVVEEEVRKVSFFS